MIKYIGIDGCKSGWFYVGLDQAGNSSFGVFCEISELPDFLPCAEIPGRNIYLSAILRPVFTMEYCYR